MSVQIFLSTTLRKHISEYNPDKGIEYNVNEKKTIAEVLEHFNIPVDKVKIIMVDGTNQSLDFLLKGNERVGLFPLVGGG